jgi:hypothetical protein
MRLFLATLVAFIAMLISSCSNSQRQPEFVEVHFPSTDVNIYIVDISSADELAIDRSLIAKRVNSGSISIEGEGRIVSGRNVIAVSRDAVIVNSRSLHNMNRRQNFILRLDGGFEPGFVRTFD